MAIDGAKFRAPVEPGVPAPARRRASSRSARRVCKFAGKASVDGKLAAEASFTAMIADPPAPDRRQPPGAALNPEDLREALAGHQASAAIRPICTMPPATSRARSKRGKPAEVVERDDHQRCRRSATGRGPLQQPKHPIGVEVGGRLVEQQQPWAAPPAPARSAPGALAGRQIVRPAGPASAPSSSCSTNSAIRPRRAGRAQARSRRAPHRPGHVARGGKEGEQLAAPRLAWTEQGSPSIATTPAAPRSRQGAEQAGLAAAVGPDQRRPSPAGEVEIDRGQAAGQGEAVASK